MGVPILVKLGCSARLSTAHDRLGCTRIAADGAANIIVFSFLCVFIVRSDNSGNKILRLVSIGGLFQSAVSFSLEANQGRPIDDICSTERSAAMRLPAVANRSSVDDWRCRCMAAAQMGASSILCQQGNLTVCKQNRCQMSNESQMSNSGPRLTYGMRRVDVPLTRTDLSMAVLPQS